jgi:PAS domain S-box-containing protein
MAAGDDDDDTTVAVLRAELAQARARAERAEEALGESRAVLAAAIESMPFEFWARNREGYCISQNAMVRENWGDLLHKRPEDMGFPAPVIETWLENNRRALSGEVVRGDVEYPTASGTRHVHNVLAPIRVGDAIVGTLGVNIDITEQRRTLLALRESEEKLRMAVDAAGIGLWSWDPAVDDVRWEPTLSAIFGLPAGAAPVGREGYLALIHPDDRERAGAKIAWGVENGGWEDEYRVLRKDGAVRWVLAKGHVIRDAAGTRIVGAVIDVTERKLRDEQLRQAQKLEAVGQLTAGIAHNFNNMLMGVLPNVELAARRAPPDLVPFLESAASSASRAADLVRKLMTYAGRNRPKARAVEDVGQLAARAVDLCRTTFDKRIAFEQTFEPGAHALVDSTQVEQALLNILINARDAVESPRISSPRVTVSVGTVRAGAPELSGRGGGFVRVRVRDNGVGMGAATAQRIYEPFFTTKEVGKGTGLGLATTHAIVHEHGGFITCDTAPGAGATFSMYLPCEPGARVESAAPPRVAARGTETVLVIDDEPAIRRIVTLMLSGAGYSVHEAASGAEAIALLARRELAAQVSLVLLDVSMPGLPPRELRRLLRELTRAKVVYFTGYALDAADAAEDDVVLEKPVSEERLLSTIRRVLDA